MLKELLGLGMAVIGAIAAGLDNTHPLATTYRTSVTLNQGEDKRLASHSDLAVRDGLALKIFHIGRLIHTAVDVSCGTDDVGNCHSYYFVGPVQLMSPVSHRVETYAQFGELFYEGTGGYFIPLENGRMIHTDAETLGSPDGRQYASGSESVDEQGETATNLTISATDGKARDIVFAPSCLPNQWTGAAQLTALCEYYTYDGLDMRFEGLATRDAAGHWTLKITRLLAYNPPQGTTTPPDLSQVFEGTPAK